MTDHSPDTGNMVERVARALREARAVKFAGNGSVEQVDCERLARAAIAAMREPTTEMIISGTEQWLCEAALEDRSEANWRAMIDEALR